MLLHPLLPCRVLFEHQKLNSRIFFTKQWHLYSIIHTLFLGIIADNSSKVFHLVCCYLEQSRPHAGTQSPGPTMRRICVQVTCVLESHRFDVVQWWGHVTSVVWCAHVWLVWWGHVFWSCDVCSHVTVQQNLSHDQKHGNGWSMMNCLVILVYHLCSSG